MFIKRIYLKLILVVDCKLYPKLILVVDCKLLIGLINKRIQILIPPAKISIKY